MRTKKEKLKISMEINEIEKGKTMVVSRFWGEENGELSFNRYRISVWENEKVLETDGGDICIAMWMYLMPLNSTLKNG